MKIFFNILILCFLVFISCRGITSKEPPIHLLQNMDDGGKLDPQSQNLASYEVDEEPYEDLNGDGKWNPAEPFEDLNENGQWDRSSIEYISASKTSMLYMSKGTVATNFNMDKITDTDVERANEFNTGKNKEGKYIIKNPKTVDLKLLNRGEERYNIYCSACHGISGNGNGVVLHKNYSWKTGVKPANLLDLSDREDIAYDGYLFDVISNGKNRMGGYGAQIGVDDRWAIVAYLRVLDYAAGGCSDYSSIKNNLNKINSLEDQLMSNDFECLIELGKVQDYYDKQMKEIQKIVKCDDYDGKWGQGTKRKWNDWKKGLINED